MTCDKTTRTKALLMHKTSKMWSWIWVGEFMIRTKICRINTSKNLVCQDKNLNNLAVYVHWFKELYSQETTQSKQEIGLLEY